ncbi:hypothetical protein MBLNU230_g6237t1 [Neophaeotheca triangularis]
MVNRVEILVHAGAPSKQNDDARYKAQAQAYLGFQGSFPPSSRASRQAPQSPSAPAPGFDLENVGDSVEKGRSSTTMLPDTTRLNDTTLLHLPNSLAYLDDTQLGYSALESQLLTSSLITPARRDLKRPTSAISEIPTSRLIVETPLETPRDQDGSAEEQTPSSYLQTPVLDRSNKKPRLLDRLREEQVVANTTEIGYSGGATLRDGEIAASPRALSCPHGNAAQQLDQEVEGSLMNENDQASADMNSELPTTYSLSNMSSRSPRSLLRSQQRSTSDPTALISPRKHQRSQTSSISASQPVSNHAVALAVTQALPSAPQAVPTKKDALPVHVEREPSAEPTTTVPSEANEERTKTHFKRTQPAAHTTAQRLANPPPKPPEPLKHPALAARTSLPPSPTTLTSTQIIRPPSPPPGIEPFKSHITHSLSYLASHSDISAKYNPTAVTRSLQSLERGHWVFETRTWPSETREECWQFLESFVGSGKAGWGVWCSREKAGIGGAGEGGVLRVYCWGEVIEHVYLMLYVASKSRVRKAGLRWVDSGGEAVVVMP